MDDNFLNDLRREPDPGFARRLKASLDGGADAAQRWPQSSRIAKWTALAASVAAVSLVLTLPPVRAGAQAFLDLFRIASISGFAFDDARLNQLQRGLDLPSLFGGTVAAASAPPAEVSFGSLEDAGAAAGLRVTAPAWLPAGWARAEIAVVGEHTAEVRADVAALNALLDSLGIDDLSVPAEIDGQTATLKMYPVVTTTFRSSSRRAQLLQARSPEVSFPAELDLPVLAEMGLRILGLDREEAYRLAWSIDWTTTLLVPVPTSAASFTDVNVAGNEGLLIAPRYEMGQKLLLWAAGGQVFALSAAMTDAELLEIAQSLQ